MVFRLIIFCALLITSQCFKSQKCLTGYMTDIQSWVDDKGVLTSTLEYERSIDLSANSNPVPILQQKMTIIRTSSDIYVKYLSLARCRLSRVPLVFQFRDSQGRDLAETVEYVTFYGNDFQDINTPGEEYSVSMNATSAREMTGSTSGLHTISNTVWSTSFKETDFPRLKELDLRSCAIQVLNANIFTGMPQLEALYIGENEIATVDADAFAGLNNLIHLDFSRNKAYDNLGNLKTMTLEAFHVFEPLRNLASLDFSFTKLLVRQLAFFKSLGPNLTRLSLCETDLASLDDDFFNHTSIRILDVSGNNGIFARTNILRGLENTLEVLYAKDIGLRTMGLFKDFKNLEILNLSVNEITRLDADVAETLSRLKILDLDKNRVISWFEKTFFNMPKLQLLSLKDNNINLISEEMIRDMSKVNYVALSGNFIVCNCHTRDFFDLALQNEQRWSLQKTVHARIDDGPLLKTYHSGFKDFNYLIDHRSIVFLNCTDETEETCFDEIDEDLDVKFLLLDFHPTTYMCLQVNPESKSVEFSEVIGCNRSARDIDYDKVMSESTNLLYILLGLPCIMVLLGFGYMFRRNFRYCFITLRNSALLSMINKDEVLDVISEDTIFHYDVFVSYCNEDRNWVLDHLIPHLEKDCSISACLHERDFQVGHSILENIVSCMDRSRSIMLIISQRFLLSQWCQFEMHLAQHRLLETRREDLTLVLLEEIPRRLRPNTLHYLMLTKTYIVWPKDEHDRILFWKRLKKGFMTLKMKQTPIEGVSDV